jgi:hypothetical protein
MDTRISAHGAAWAGLSAAAARYDVLYCDVWGVVHDGVAALRPAGEALARFRAGGGTVVLITNAPRPRRPIMQMLDRMGVPREVYDTIVSSGDVTVDLVAAREGTPLYHLGPARDLPCSRPCRSARGARPRSSRWRTRLTSSARACSTMPTTSTPISRCSRA